MATGRLFTARSVPTGRFEMFPASTASGKFGTSGPRPQPAAAQPASSNVRRLSGMHVRRPAGLAIQGPLLHDEAMSGRLTEEELAELEAEAQQMSSWALDEADVRRLSLRRQAFAEL